MPEAAHCRCPGNHTLNFTPKLVARAMPNTKRARWFGRGLIISISLASERGNDDDDDRQHPRHSGELQVVRSLQPTSDNDR